MPTRDLGTDEYRERLLCHAARRTGVLDALATTTGTAEGVAEETGIDPHAADLLVEALADRGFLKDVGGEYQPTNRMLGILTKTDVRSIGRLSHDLDRLDAWLAFPGTARGESPPRSEHRTRNELGARAARPEAQVRGAVTAMLREAPDAESVVLVGDAPGPHAVEVAARRREVTLVDTPERVDASRAGLEHESVTLRGGDPADSGCSLPEADLVAGVGVLYRLDEGGATTVLRNARAAAPTCVFVEPVAETGDDGYATLAALDAFAREGTASVHDRAGVVSLVEESGYGEATVVDIPGLDDRAVVGR
ncbi:SAM-dependent methyltransferase [Halomarina oriensis]|uniref:SAM-dependent methyltransferase n=1 Tax=Halomarina oriensis TaxID=671145 RepID=A0A6B0GPU3_9EURY|nr:SAM-dependent methyltransferase [Halomarina oriensis]MWG35589.1 SAM-dependent methyltransferase [Halomarina oriensis]